MKLAKKQEIIEVILKKITGSIFQISLRHDSSRIIQSIIQYGNPNQLTRILNELYPKLMEIAKTPYGHFIILKIIQSTHVYADQNRLIHALSKHLIALGSNVISARIIEAIFHYYPTKLVQVLRAEFYGQVCLSVCQSVCSSVSRFRRNLRFYCLNYRNLYMH